MLLVAVFGLNLGAVAIAFASLDGRFLMHGLPMLMPLAGSGIVVSARRLYRQLSS